LRSRGNKILRFVLLALMLHASMSTRGRADDAPAAPSQEPPKKSLRETIMAMEIDKDRGITVGDTLNNPLTSLPAVGATLSVLLALRAARYPLEAQAFRSAWYANDMEVRAHEAARRIVDPAQVRGGTPSERQHNYEVALRRETNVQLARLRPQYDRISPSWNPFQRLRRTDQDRAYRAEAEKGCDIAAAQMGNNLVGFVRGRVLPTLAVGGATGIAWQAAVATSGSPDEHFRKRKEAVQDGKITKAVEDKVSEKVPDLVAAQVPEAVQKSVQSQLPQAVDATVASKVKESLEKDKPRLLKDLEDGKLDGALDNVVSVIDSVLRDKRTLRGISYQLTQNSSDFKGLQAQSVEKGTLLPMLNESQGQVKKAILEVVKHHFKASQDHGTPFRLTAEDLKNPDADLMEELVSTSLRQYFVSGRLMRETDNNLPIDLATQQKIRDWALEKIAK
jgi:hypothetical protein